MLVETPPTDLTPVVVTGGTGSFGRAFVRYLLTGTGASVRVFSRDEHKQADMAQEFPPGPRLTYILGDVRYREKLRRAFDGAAAVVHAAALKTVPAGERHADEFVATNVYGSQNVVTAAIEAGVRHTLLISSDKACSPLNHYGATKKTAEGLFIQGNSLGTLRGSRFACVRGGNVWGSRGSVATVWRQAAAAGQPLTVTGANATRFHMQMADWTAYCWRVIRQMHGGEIFVPKARAWRLLDLADAFGAPYVVADERPGDKLHESMIGVDEAARAVDAGWTYLLEPAEDFRRIWNYEPWAGASAFNRAYTSEWAERIERDELGRIVEALA